ncbi:protein phosphatase 2C domain-containing protein [Solwaraspora sp. WMMB762]|uniref:protein phosphatase 2C domain-containing protein n=1 Tax=Solwaraspora sp. WMMB762 TaxID=3404120 RepID=UPI003B9470D1
MEDDALGTHGVSRIWQATNVSVTGAAHHRGDVECQDDSISRSWDSGLWALVAVADGHGSEAHFRSRRGAEFAVAAMEEVFSSYRDLEEKPSVLRTMASTKVDWCEAPNLLVANWYARVRDDLIADPPRIFELDPVDVRLGRYIDHVIATRGPAAAQRLHDQFAAFESYAESVHSSETEPADPDAYGLSPQEWDAERLGDWHLRAYGSTALGVLIGPDAIHWLQIGDGAMVTITGGEPSYLCPPQAEAIANATPSLCDDNARYRISAGTVPVVPGNVPSAVILVTDGVPNSFENQAGFFQFCADIAKRALGTADLSADLERWLPEMSRQGSGDDMSVAMAWATDGPIERHGRPQVTKFSWFESDRRDGTETTC